MINIAKYTYVHFLLINKLIIGVMCKIYCDKGMYHNYFD